jgi:hypothetical protein
VPWSKPSDIVVQAGQALPLPGVPFGDEGWAFHVCFVDGSIRFLNHGSMSEAIICLLINPRDGAVVPDF